MLAWILRNTKDIGKQCVSAPAYPVIIGNVRGARHMLPDPDWKAGDLRGARARSNAPSNNDGNKQGDDMPSWIIKEESNRGETKNRDSKKLAQLNKNDNRATQVQEGTTEGKYVAGPVLKRA